MVQGSGPRAQGSRRYLGLKDPAHSVLKVEVGSTRHVSVPKGALISISDDAGGGTFAAHSYPGCQ